MNPASPGIPYSVLERLVPIVQRFVAENPPVAIIPLPRSVLRCLIPSFTNRPPRSINDRPIFIGIRSIRPDFGTECVQ